MVLVEFRDGAAGICPCPDAGFFLSKNCVPSGSPEMMWTSTKSSRQGSFPVRFNLLPNFFIKSKSVQ
jgi:hypothetical protein